MNGRRGSGGEGLRRSETENAKGEGLGEGVCASGRAVSAAHRVPRAKSRQRRRARSTNRRAAVPADLEAPRGSRSRSRLSADEDGAV
eukprot:1011886-Pleurochrysis_carterae.AAC.1